VSDDSTIITFKQYGENVDSCSRACDQDGTCVGFAFNDSSAQYCTLYSEIEATGEGTHVDYVFRKACPTASSSSGVATPVPTNLPVLRDSTCGAAGWIFVQGIYFWGLLWSGWVLWAWVGLHGWMSG